MKISIKNLDKKIRIASTNFTIYNISDDPEELEKFASRRHKFNTIQGTTNMVFLGLMGGIMITDPNPTSRLIGIGLFAGFLLQSILQTLVYIEEREDDREEKKEIYKRLRALEERLSEK